MAAGPSNKKLKPNLETTVLDRRVDGLQSHTNELEKRVKTVVQYYENNEGPTDGAHNESTRSNRMQEFMQQFREILRQIMKRKWAFPFLKPVNPEALHLHDYYEIIKKPMDLGTIVNRMEAKEESRRYKNVTDICADVRLVFSNAMLYNEPASHAYMMAQELSSQFEKLWYPLSLKVVEEEGRQEEVEIQEARIEKLAQDTDKELMELSRQLEELKRHVKQRCRKMSYEEKYMLVENMGRLSVENVNKAAEIIAKYYPDLDASTGDVDLDLNSLSEDGQWRLYHFVKNALKQQEREQNAKMGNASYKKKK
ncbi:Transcription factor GTE1 [Rhynchospora pubera]|uniref:Transcription factor GTE1 n=1 Tax=Rhynchospora pubera TaxID=906938 RepID=A0AAV8E1I8_9POAL|nr:Transcription factor GTE1 [Rhynchospora pubera]